MAYLGLVNSRMKDLYDLGFLARGFSIDGERLCQAIKNRESITLPGFGGFYVRQDRSSWTFKFNPAQRLRARFGWSSTSKGPL